MKVVTFIICYVLQIQKIQENGRKQKILTNPGNRYFIQVYHLLMYNIHHNLPISM